MKKILYITTIPSPYRVAYFNELGKKCDLTVLFEKAGSEERDDEWKNYMFKNFRGVILPGKRLSVNTAFCPTVLHYLKKPWDEIVCCDVSTLTGMLSIQYMKMRKINYWLEGDGAFAKHGKGFKERIKKHFIVGAYGYFSTSNALDDYYKCYGANPSKIKRYIFSSVTENQVLDLGKGDEGSLIKNRCILRKQARIELGMDANQIIVLAVGQFIYRKGFDNLLKAAKYFNDKVVLYLIGGKPTEEYLRMCEQYSLNNIRFEEFKHSDVLKKYYLAADFFVLPTREDIWGLVINEAMANALPVVTTTKCVAGQEMVKDDYNGYLVEPDDIHEMASKINELTMSKNLRNRFAINAADVGKKYTIERMVESHFPLFVEG